MMRELSDIRKEIDELDRKIQTLYERRLDVSCMAAEAKKEKGLPIFDAVREEEKIRMVRDAAADREKGKAAEKLYRTLMEATREYEEEKMKNGEN